MRALLSLSVILICLAAPLRAAELVMFESDHCEWCHSWHAEVGAIYSKTTEGKVVQLRRVDIDKPRPADLKQIQRVIYTPTFVLMSDGHEVGRITGYPGEGLFWDMYAHMVRALFDDIDGCPPGTAKDRVADVGKSKRGGKC
ncbi:MAG: hypothetical protein VW268_08830 [Rhodospirillaceae bacterium]